MRVLIAEGVYFGEQQHLSSELVLNGFEVKVVNFDHPHSNDFEEELAKADLLILRSRWSASPEESILAKIFAKKYEAYAQSISKCIDNKEIKLFAVGRGALFGLFSDLLKAKVSQEISWKPVDMVNKTWLNTKIRTKTNVLIDLRALVSGRAIPEELVPVSNTVIKKWAEEGKMCFGWSVGENVYLSFVDLLSLSERAQLPDYGYEDLSNIKNRISLVGLFQSGEL